jgi:hypothetical protein
MKNAAAPETAPLADDSKLKRADHARAAFAKSSILRMKK